MLISKRTKASIACWIISVIVALAVIIPLRFFSSFGLSNSCLVVGLVYLGVIFFIYINRWGMFDTFRFQFINFCYSFRKGSPHKYKDAGVVFTGYGNWYYCHSQEVAEDMMNYYWGKTKSGDEYIAGINATYAADNTTVSEIDCLMAWGGSDGYYSLTTFGFKNFGTANNNDYNAAITAAFAA